MGVFSDITEFSIYHPLRRQWLAVGEDGGIRFDSDEPVSLREFYTAPNVGSEAFAYGMLEWLRSQAGSGEVIQGRYVDVTEHDLSCAGVFAFSGAPPEEAELEFNHRFRSKHVLFEVSGTPQMVDAYLTQYETDFPPATFNTLFSVQQISPDKKTVRVFRHNLV